MTHPTDAAIAQAFRERLESMYSPLTVREVMKAVEDRARELDAEKGGACCYPDCNCPFDHPGTPGWCARGLATTPPAQAAESVQVSYNSGETLSKQAAEAMDRAMDTADTIMHRLEGWDRAYPTDIFREVTDEESKWLHETRPGLIDRISAGMGRHMAGCIREDLATLRAAIAAMSKGEG